MRQAKVQQYRYRAAVRLMPDLEELKSRDEFQVQMRLFHFLKQSYFDAQVCFLTWLDMESLQRMLLPVRASLNSHGTRNLQSRTSCVLILLWPVGGMPEPPSPSVAEAALDREVSLASWFITAAKITHPSQCEHPPTACPMSSLPQHAVPRRLPCPKAREFGIFKLCVISDQ